VSHQPERKHKNCLNCGVLVKGRYCQRCGQENIETKQSAWSLIKHFVFDLFHFDGKFFHTLGMLFGKPGMVAREYVSGKRTKHLDPIRMYLFTSAVFFLIFFSLNTYQPREKGLERILSKSERMDAVMELNRRKDSLRPMEKQAWNALLDSSLIVELKKDTSQPSDSTVYFNGNPYRVSWQVDSTWYEPPPNGESWIARVMAEKTRRILQENRNDPEEGFKKIGLEIYHRLPYILFVSLPFFALILKLIYLRRNRFYYTDHIIFTLYHYIFSFLLMLLLTGFLELFEMSQRKIFGWLTGLCVVYWFYYLYKGLRFFYGQSRLKTMGKFLLLNILGLVVFIFLFVVFAFFTFFEF
jgi:hypothetical protein